MRLTPWALFVAIFLSAAFLPAECGCWRVSPANKPPPENRGRRVFLRCYILGPQQ
jgi:hypothetical protein